jgi:hypothetical protein
MKRGASQDAVDKGRCSLGSVHEVFQKVCQLFKFEEGLSYKVKFSTGLNSA